MKVNKGIAGNILKIYKKLIPVGYYFYWSPVSGSTLDLSTPEKVHDYFGFGTWELNADIVLMGAGNKYTANSTGGEETHTLTIDEIPSHTHTYTAANKQTETGYGMVDSSVSQGYEGRVAIDRKTTASGASGGSTAHNNLQPYKATYIWQRIA